MPSTTSNDSMESSQSPPPQTPQKRKPTYLVRKEEENALKDEILQLQAQVAVLKTQGMPAGSAVAANPVLQQATAKTKVLGDIMRNQQLGIAAAQSLLMECARTQYSNPLCTRIYLKSDWGDRRATLLNIREEKLRNAYNYVVARSSRIHGGQGQDSSELQETDSGDIVSLNSSVIHFPGVKSLRQVFEALWFYLTNMEISISERLGNITVREDYDMIEGSAFNSRIMSSDSNGITTESNTIVFAQLFEEGDPRFGGEPCALVASDCVDEDELYPYRTSQHVRKDISGGIVLTANRQKKPITDEDAEEEELVVTMRRTGYLKIYRPEFPVSPFALQELEAGIADWGQVMIKAMREILYARM
ncbi:uncharacterized protein KRP23_3996 [Phytophthora ramorum]|uniref:Uncharacterized protein n=1 Tax=Phytophthora ramorum TaxID=164328 RepID=H3H0P1_PHYRM|nr:hypothetical protein KRP23_3996 [Phytophthora ramorum]